MPQLLFGILQYIHLVFGSKCWIEALDRTGVNRFAGTSFFSSSHRFLRSLLHLDFVVPKAALFKACLGYLSTWQSHVCARFNFLAILSRYCFSLPTQFPSLMMQQSLLLLSRFTNSLPIMRRFNLISSEEKMFCQKVRSLCSYSFQP